MVLFWILKIRILILFRISDFDIRIFNFHTTPKCYKRIAKNRHTIFETGNQQFLPM